jgi:cyanophycin synthetase
MLDYGHNFPGYRQVISACKNLGCSRLVGVIGMPGDRGDDAIRSVGTLCAGAFDRIYIKEDLDKRGRAPSEVANLFYEAILSSDFDKDKVSIIENELDALKKAIGEAQAGDLIVVFYEELEPLQDYLNTLNAKAKNE